MIFSPRGSLSRSRLRNSLANLRSSLIGNDKLENLLQEMIQNQELLHQAGSEAGIRAPEEKEK